MGSLVPIYLASIPWNLTKLMQDAYKKRITPIQIDFFSFQMKLIPHYSKLFVDLTMYKNFVLCVNLSSYSV